jgi:hypothetical protein
MAHGVLPVGDGAHSFTQISHTVSFRCFDCVLNNKHTKCLQNMQRCSKCLRRPRQWCQPKITSKLFEMVILIGGFQLFGVRRLPLELVLRKRRFAVLQRRLLGQVRRVLSAVQPDHHGARHGGRGAQVPPGVLLLRLVRGFHRRRGLLRTGGTLQALLVRQIASRDLYWNRRFSGQCYKRQMQPLTRTARCPFIRKPHSIRLVEIPGGQKGIKLDKDSIGTGNSQCFTISE